MTSVAATGEIQRRIAAGERDFQGESLAGARLRGVNLRGANLSGSNLRGANLHGADLREARLVRADLGLADLGMTDFRAADLNSADFRGANLKGANFNGSAMIGANFRGADLHGADLRRAKLVRTDLSRADLRLADISEADLRGADLRGADLSGANLLSAGLNGATLHGADLREANLSGANLRGANLTSTDLRGALLTGAAVGETVFADLDLRLAVGLETLEHSSPSTVGADTLSRSLGKLPENFLQGCGLTAWEILAAREHDATLTSKQLTQVRARSTDRGSAGRLQRKRVLISYSLSDQHFVSELRRMLLERSIFSWVAAHEAKGEVREKQAKLPMDHDLAFVLVLSGNSMRSHWVDHEVRLARKLERLLGEAVLFPINLDDEWKSTASGVVAPNEGSVTSALSFAAWPEKAVMEKQVGTLLEALALFHPLVGP